MFDVYSVLREVYCRL